MRKYIYGDSLYRAATALAYFPVKYSFNFFALWTLYLSLPFLMFGTSSYVQNWEEGESYIGYSQGFSSKIFEFFPHYWTPNALFGLDTLSTALDPGLEGIFYSILPGWLAHGFYQWFILLVGSYFTYRLLKDIFCIASPLSILGGMIFSVIHFNIPEAQMQACLPLVLWLLLSINAKNISAYFVTILLAVLFSINSIYPYSIFIVPFICTFYVFMSKENIGLRLLISSVFFLSFLLIEYRGLYAGISLATMGNRSSELKEYGSFLLLDYPRAQIVLILALLGIVAQRFKSKALNLIVALYILASLGPNLFLFVLETTSIFPASFNSINIRTNLAKDFLIIPGGMIGLSALCKVLTKYGFKPLSHKSVRKNYLRAFFLGSFLIILISISDQKNRIVSILLGENFGAMYLHPDLQDLAQETKKDDPFRIANFVAQRYGESHKPAHTWPHGFETIGGFFDIFPKSTQDYFELIIDKLIKKEGVKKKQEYLGSRLQLTGPANSSIWKMCGQKTIKNCSLELSNYYNFDLLSLANVKYIVSPIPLSDYGLKLLPSAYRNSLLSWEHKKPSEKLIAAVNGAPSFNTPIYIYQNLNYVPRFFIVNKIEGFETTKKLLAEIKSMDIQKLTSKALFINEDIPGLNASNFGGEGRVELKSYQSDKIILSTQTNGKTVLVISNSYSKYWLACVNGKLKSVFPFYRAFQGIILEAGHNNVVLEYVPPYKIGNLEVCN